MGGIIIRRVPATERGFIDLSRQQQIKQELYLYLQQKWEETAISKQANISNSKVIDSPRTGINPISPRRMIILLACILLGLLIPFVILYLRELLNVRISSKEDVTNKINTPIVGEIVNHDEEGVQEVIQDSGVMDNLKLVSSGPIPPNPAEIILNDRTQVFFDTLKKEFDYIIVDAPPIGVVTDAQLLARYTDTTLYVIRHGVTYKKQLEIPVDLERHRKLPNISLVVNGIQLRRYGGYGYGG